MGVFVILKKKRKVVNVKNPVLKPERRAKYMENTGRDIFGDVHNGQTVELPLNCLEKIEIDRVVNAKSLLEPMTWRNSYEAVITKVGYVLVGGDVTRGLETGMNEYPIYWYASIKLAKRDYDINVPDQPKKKKKPIATDSAPDENIEKFKRLQIAENALLLCEEGMDDKI